MVLKKVGKNLQTIRIWRLGSLEHKLYPSKHTIDKLREILKDNIKNGVLDLVWGPELSVTGDVTTIDTEDLDAEIEKYEQLLVDLKKVREVRSAV